MEVTELGIVTETKLEQVSKADSPIVTTEFGIIISVKSLQALKALTPIVVMVLGIDILFKRAEFSNALSPIAVTVYCFALYVTVEGITNSLGKPFIFEKVTVVSLVMVYCAFSIKKSCANPRAALTKNINNNTNRFII
ncbi:hypothetical protein GCM10011518_27030 [Flavobacterium limi]|uniref:Uncharacterized protein n=1 Tax=Flavobacterium limi TaxID=2045105 RepID=A0ABQ1UD13_9FLAO|nr:hypothetical protein GCM10011518_27030 [Flavobacterium limi]